MRRPAGIGSRRESLVRTPRGDRGQDDGHRLGGDPDPTMRPLVKATMKRLASEDGLANKQNRQEEQPHANQPQRRSQAVATLRRETELIRVETQPMITKTLVEREATR